MATGRAGVSLLYTVSFGVRYCGSGSEQTNIERYFLQKTIYIVIFYPLVGGISDFPIVGGLSMHTCHVNGTGHVNGEESLDELN